MRYHRGPKAYFNGVRLFSLELFRLKRGFARYSGRASALAADLRCSKAARKIAKLEQELYQELAQLEEKVVAHAQ